MSSRPTQYWVVGQKVLDKIKNEAPPDVQVALRDLLLELRTDPYPRPGRYNVSEVKGTQLKHLYVAWCDEARVSYRVAQDQPAILLLGVHWFGPPEGPDEGEDDDGWDFSLAA